MTSGAPEQVPGPPSGSGPVDPASPGPGPAPVTFRLFASARAAAGTAEVRIAPGPTVDVVTSLAAGLPAGFADVLAVSSLLTDGTHVDRSATVPIPAGTVIDVLPPFAGG